MAGEKNQDVFLKFHSLLFENQPVEGGSTDHTNEDLAKLAREAGANDSTQRCIATGAQVQAAAGRAAVDESAFQGRRRPGQHPSVLLEGKKVDVSNPNWLADILKGRQVEITASVRDLEAMIAMVFR